MTLTRRTLLFVGYCLCLALVHVQVLRALYDYSRESVSASHVVLIPLVTVFLILQDRASIFSSVRTSWAAGLSLMLLGAGLAIGSAAYAGSLSWAIGALVVLSIGGFVLLYGRDASIAALFPLGFLVFMIPIPEVLLNGVTLLLKKGSAETVAGLFAVSGTAYHRQGFVFTLPHFVIEIADECSGIRSSLALLLTTLLAGHMFLKSPVNKLLLVLAIVPVAILKNAIRIACLSLLAIHVDPDYLVGRLHHEGGIVFFLLALAVIAPLFSLLRQAESRLTAGVRPA